MVVPVVAHLFVVMDASVLSLSPKNKKPMKTGKTLRFLGTRVS